VSGNGWDRPQFFPNEVLGIYISSATIGTVLPVLNDVVTRFDRVVALYSVRPHKLILHGFLGKGKLLDKTAFKREKGVIDNVRIPGNGRLVLDGVTNKSRPVIVFRS
jgi:hypothetical protein